VLVNAPYDTPLRPLFFFPGQSVQKLEDASGVVHAARRAEIRLGFVPFVPLHDLLERYQRPRSYSDLVQRARGDLGRRLRVPVQLRLHVRERRLVVNDSAPLRLGVQPFLFLLFLAECARSGLPPVVKYVDAMAPFESFVLRAAASRPPRAPWMLENKKLLPADFAKARENRDDLPLRKHLLLVLNNKLRGHPPCEKLLPYLPEVGRCSLDLPPERIEILD